MRQCGQAFGFWVDGNVVVGSGLEKGDWIFANGRRSKKPVGQSEKSAEIRNN